MQSIKKLSHKKLPPQLLEIPQPPKHLYIEGELPNEDTILLAVVGSRKYTSYGKEACERLIASLAGQNIAIVSGLAIGIDSIAHRAALSAGLKTIAIPGSGLSNSILYPALNRSLAKQIIEKGGCLLSEFEPDFKATTWSFPQRNRIMAGISKAILIIEAEERSGTLITARMALDYNRDVLAVPGSIFSPSSKGSNWLIKNGATPICDGADILQALGIKNEDATLNTLKNLKLDFEELSENEKLILSSLTEPLSKDELCEVAEIEIGELNGTLSMLEIKGYVKEEGGVIHRFK